MNAKQKHTWYEASTGKHQGLIIEEKTGDNIAVTYKKENAQVIIKAVNNFDGLVDACKMALSWSESVASSKFKEVLEQALRNAEA